MDVIFKQCEEEYVISDVGQAILYGEFISLHVKRGDFMGSVNLSKCETFTIVDNDPEN